MLVGREIDRGICGIHRSRQRAVPRIDILIELLVIGEDRPVLDRQSVLEIVLDDGHGGLHLGARHIQGRAAEERRKISVRRERRRRIETRRPPGGRLRGIAAIGRAFVVEIFVREFDLGVVVGLQRHRRVDAVALDPAEVAERVGSLVEGVDAHGDVFIDRLAGIEREPPIVPGAGLHRSIVDPGTVGFLQRTVEKAAARATAEGQRARPLQNLDALGVVEIAEILNVVAKAVDEEVGAGIDAADHQLVAVAFALMHGDARNVAGDVGEALKTLVPDEIPGDHAERLRNVEQSRVGLGRNRRAVGVNADRAGTRVLRLRESLRRRSRLRPPLGQRMLPLGAAIGAPAGRSVGAAFRCGSGDLDRRKLRFRQRRLRRCRGLRACRRRAGQHAKSGVAHRKQNSLRETTNARLELILRCCRAAPTHRVRAPRNPIPIRSCGSFATSDEALVSSEKIRVNAIGALRCLNRSRSKRF